MTYNVFGGTLLNSTVKHIVWCSSLVRHTITCLLYENV